MIIFCGYLNFVLFYISLYKVFCYYITVTVIMSSDILLPAAAGEFVNNHVKHVTLSQEGVVETAQRVNIYDLYLDWLALHLKVGSGID